MSMKLGLKKQITPEEETPVPAPANSEMEQPEQPNGLSAEPPTVPATNGNHLVFRGKKIEIDEVKATEEIQNIINKNRKEMNMFDIETAKEKGIEIN